VARKVPHPAQLTKPVPAALSLKQGANIRCLFISHLEQRPAPWFENLSKPGNYPAIGIKAIVPAIESITRIKQGHLRLKQGYFIRANIGWI